jgi:uncharacterized membrane protein YccC
VTARLAAMTAVSVRPLLRQALRADWDELDIAAGVRVAVCVAAPVALGVATGHSVQGMIAALGALNVGLAEGLGNYSSRARTLPAVLVGNAVAVGAGTLTAMAGWWGVLILFAWVLGAAYVGVVGPVLERTGWFAALMFMIALGLPDPGFVTAANNAGLVALGGGWAMLVIVVWWPLHPHRPVLRAVGRSLLTVSNVLQLIGRSAPVPELVAAVAHAEAVGHQAGAITRWRTVRGGHRPSAVHLRALALNSERARTYAIVLEQQLRTSDLPATDELAVREAATQLASALTAISTVLQKGRDPAYVAAVDAAIEQAVDIQRSVGHLDPVLGNLCAVVPALAGRGDDSPGAPPPPVLVPTSPWTVLQANLMLSSFWARYALRFATAAAIGLALARGVGLEMGYWVLITIAVVLKPQLSVSTTSTIHRVVGTIIGSVLGVLLVLAIPDSWGLVVALFVLTLAAISVVRINYGLGVVFVTPLVLVLLNVAHPGQWQLADARVVNTLIGAAIGLLASSWILPGSERDLVVDRSRLALVRSAAYLRAIGQAPQSERLAARRAARIATDDLLAVIDRAMAEPVPLGGAYLNASTQLAEATAELWVQETQLALHSPAGQVTAELRQRTTDSAALLDRAAAKLGGTQTTESTQTTQSTEAADVPPEAGTDPLSLILRTVLDTSGDLLRAAAPFRMKDT